MNIFVTIPGKVYVQKLTFVKAKQVQTVLHIFFLKSDCVLR